MADCFRSFAPGADQPGGSESSGQRHAGDRGNGPGQRTDRDQYPAQDDEVILEVADDGCGIPEANLPRIFDPFFTTKPVGQGTGLGLAISHGIVTDHGGRVEVESTPGQGSRFRLILPMGGKALGRNQAGRANLPKDCRQSEDQPPPQPPG